MPATQRILYADVETTCDAELKKTGASKYAKDESLIVTVLAWAFDDEPVRSVINPGTDVLKLPQEVVDHIEAGGLISGWNSGNFEYNLFKNHFGLRIRPDQVKDTMQRALYAGLPGALGDCGPALRLNIVKDNTAHRLMLQMSRPRKHKGGKTSYWHIDEPEKLARLQAYCERDVEAEREIAKYIPELPAREQKIAALDRRANERGIKLDVRLIEKMISLADVATEEIGVACSAITKGAVDSPGTQSARLVSWLKTQGVPIDSVAKAAVKDGLEACRTLETSDEGKKLRKESVWRAIVRRRRTRSSAALYRALGESPYAKARQVLELRQLVAKSSVKKLIAMLRCIEEHDQCVRGVLAYYGANRTGRWAGRLIQPQNFPRPTFKTIKEAINAILSGCTKEEIETVFPPVLEVVASCLRGCLVPRDGMRFITPDLSQIEARVIAWISGQDDILEVFARGDDVYTFTADKLGFTGPNKRQEGKVCVLGLGFGMGWRKFIATALTYGIVYEEKRAKEIVYGWREENPHIKQFWWDCDGTVKQTIRAAMQSPLGMAEGQINKHLSVMVNKARNGSYLMTILLPSGRRLFYRDVNLEPEDKEFEIREAYCLYNEGEIDEAELLDTIEEINLRPPRESITYSGINQITKKWGKVRTYGGKIAENIVQATARDVICDQALEVDDQRLGDLVLSVHDELIFEVPEDEAEERYARVEEIMCRELSWAVGLPVKSEGNVVERYGKG